MSPTTATAEVIATPSSSVPVLPGANPFPFLNVENLHHSLKTKVSTRIDEIRKESKALGLAPRDIFLASRRQICGDTAAADHLITVLRHLDVPILLLLNEQFGSIEVIDLHKCGHEQTLRSCGNRRRY